MLNVRRQKKKGWPHEILYFYMSICSWHSTRSHAVARNSCSLLLSKEKSNLKQFACHLPFARPISPSHFPFHSAPPPSGLQSTAFSVLHAHCTHNNVNFIFIDGKIKFSYLNSQQTVSASTDGLRQIFRQTKSGHYPHLKSLRSE